MNVKGLHGFRDPSAQQMELLSSKIKKIKTLSCLEDAVFCAAKAKPLCRMKDEDVKSQWLKSFLH